jgi:hypothetical protein
MCRRAMVQAAIRSLTCLIAREPLKVSMRIKKGGAKIAEQDLENLVT